MTDSLSLNEKLTEAVAIALCPWQHGKRVDGGCLETWATMTEKARNAYRDQAKAALSIMAQHNEQEVEALVG